MNTTAEALEALDRAVLSYMDEFNYQSTDFDGWFFPLRCFAEIGLERDIARAICRTLTDRGLAEYRRGLFNDDGEVAGSGYGITAAGRAYLANHDRSGGGA